MDNHQEFQSVAGFLPTVKVRPLNKLRNKKLTMPRDSNGCRPKLVLVQESKDVPQLIEDYYKRFRMQGNRSQSLSVSINFKQISQEQFESKMAKSKQKFRAETSKMKNRCNSQGYCSQKACLKKISQTQKINISAKVILHRLKSLSTKQAHKQQSFYKNYSVQQTLMEEQQIQSKKLDNSSENLADSFKPQGKCRKMKQNNDTMNCELSSVFLMKTEKKYKKQYKTLEKIQNSMPIKLGDHNKELTPWQLPRQTFYNPEQGFQVLSKSIEL